MSQDYSARLGLPYLLAGQLQKHVTLNEALTRLDLLVQTTVQSRTETTPPATPVEGALYIMPSAPLSGDWQTFEADDLIRFELGHWLRQDPSEGLTALILDEAVQVAWMDGAWTPVGGAPELDEIQGLSRLGVGTTADANNPFAAKLNKALWTALETGNGGDGDLRFTFNKQGAARVLSLLFQSNWSGRAELGLIGDDDLKLKVSANGSLWQDALSVDRTTGAVRFAKGATRRETTSVISNATWILPAWARWVEVLCIAGGGGGGAGLGGASGTQRLGGGGGGAGGMARALWPASSLTASLNLTIGHAGTGGEGNGQAGEFGGNSQVDLGSQTLLKAYGGHGGAAGSASEGRGGHGGAGHLPSNGGADASLAANGQTATGFTCPTGPGGGGAGGSLSAANVAYQGGAGAEGGVLLAALAGGSGTAGAGGQGGSASQLALNAAGGGGGGGGAVSAATGHDGGAGGLYGAGGGGGGAGLTSGGKGGAGAPGLILITAVG